MNWIVQNLWLIPALPLLAAGITALLRRRHRRAAAVLAIGSMALAFLLSCAAFAETLGGHGERLTHGFTWLEFGDAALRLGWVLDPLTAVMLVMVTFVGALIFIYSVGYMAHDENFTRFFCFLSLFAAAMLGLVIANNLLLLFISWELVGLASYLLIGFWFHKPSAAAAAKKAFITTRVGDVFFFLGMLWLYAETGTLLFYDDGAGCLEQGALAKLVGQTTFAGMMVSTAIALLIFCGAIGKSGQVPLHVWLPDAMEGPTPVSALIHAATMVAAGVFLMARVFPLVEAMPTQAGGAEVASLAQQSTGAGTETLTPALSLSERERENLRPPLLQAAPGSDGAGLQTLAAAGALPLPGGEGRGEGERTPEHSSATVSSARQAVAWIGAITAVFAALIAVAQSDIKRILAYSTVSQLGFMFLGLGAGGVAVGMFHLITHAFFKALLFLGAGSVIHGCHEEQDIRRMGGLRKFMPVTFATYAVGMMALAGVPLVFSGFWSKDEILHAAWLWAPGKWPFLLGVLGALLTAFYMTRQMCYVFFGEPRLEPAHERARPESHQARPSLFPLPEGEGQGEGQAGLRDRTAIGTERPSVPLTPALSPGQREKVPPPHPQSLAGLPAQAAAAGDSRAPHESPPVMTIPLIVLAAGAVLLSLVGTPVWPWFHDYLSGHEPHARATIEVSAVLTMLLSTLIVAAGLGLGWWLYGRRPITSADDPDALERLKPDWFAVLRGKFFIDELYELSVIRWNAAWARFCDWLDRTIWDGAVRVASLGVLGLSWLNRLVDEFVVNLGFDQGCGGLRLGARALSVWQNGQVQRYLRVLGLALVVLAVLFIWG